MPERALAPEVGDHPLLRGGSWRPVLLTDDNIPDEVGLILKPHPSLHHRKGQVIVALAEARGNVVRHTLDPSGGTCFLRQAPTGKPAIELLFGDLGPGLPINGMTPPYPPHMVGKVFEYRRTLDGFLSCTVMSENTVEMSFREADLAASLSIEDLPVGGMGLSIMAKVMDRVTYVTHVGPWNYLWLVLGVPDESVNR